METERKTNLDKWTHDLKRSVAEALGRGYLSPSAFCVLLDAKTQDTLIVSVPLVDFQKDIVKVRELCESENCVAVCRLNPAIMPPRIDAPERETPGIKAVVCAIPIISA